MTVESTSCHSGWHNVGRITGGSEPLRSGLLSQRAQNSGSAPNAGETLSTPPRLKLFYIDRIVISIDIGGPSDLA